MAKREIRFLAKRLYVEEGLTHAQIAKRIGVSQRSVERWASEENWSMLKQNNVVPIDSIKTQFNGEHEPRETYRKPRRSGRVDELEIVDTAILGLDEQFRLMLHEQDLVNAVEGMGAPPKPVDTRGLGVTAGALIKFLEYRRKIKPPTVADLADVAIEMGYSPDTFLRELSQAWQRQRQA